MKKNLSYYLSLEYPVTLEHMEDGEYCASIQLLKGCKGYGKSNTDALGNLAMVKESLLELMLSQNKFIPEPTVILQIPQREFSRFPNKKKLEQYLQQA